MPRETFRDRLWYRVDTLMSRGAGVLVIGLFAATLLLIFLIATFITVIGWADESGFNFLDVLWRTFLTTLDPGTVANFLGGTASAGYLLSLLGATLFGILVTSILISILVTGIQGRLEELRKGRSRVIETGHTVILGWSPQIFAILSELVLANANQRRSSIVVMAPRDKVEMEDAIHQQVGRTRSTRIICRTGDPVAVTDLALANIDRARSIIVLPPDVEDPDIDVIKTILAITNNPRRRAEPYHIVAELRENESLAVARIASRNEARLVLVGDLIARITAQTCRQSGLSIVYTELLDFEGDEIYEAAPPPAELVGRPFRECLFAYDDSTVIGILGADGRVRLDPPMASLLEPGDRLLAISADDDTVVPAARSLDILVDEAVLVAARPRSRVTERTLVLGWNRRGPSIARELDTYVEPGSVMVVAATDADLASGPMDDGDLPNLTRDVRSVDPTKRASLERLCAEGFDHVIVLCSDVSDPRRADARTLVTLINLRDIVAGAGHRFSITSEMLDVRNRDLAEVTGADDFIVSDRLAGLLLSQLSENRHLKAVFDDLFDTAGAEIYLRPVSDYVRLDTPMAFATVLEATTRRGELAIGYRRDALADDARQAYGVALNPRKSRSVTFAAGDKVIVLADGSSDIVSTADGDAFAGASASR